MWEMALISSGHERAVNGLSLRVCKISVPGKSGLWAEVTLLQHVQDA